MSDVKLPSKATMLDLAGLGMKVSLGMGVGALSSALVSRAVPKFSLGPISSRTMVGAGSTIVLYMGHRFASAKDFGKVADVLKFASAGSCAFTLGSLVADGLAFFNVQSPLLNTAVAVSTGVSPDKVADSPDVDTAFA